MATETELKLLTLLNVSAIKRPRDLDIPGGHRGSPSGSTSGGSPAGPAPAKPAGKKRKSVNFGGEVGPSGSTYGKKLQNAGKGKGKEVNGNGHGHRNGNGNGVSLQADVGEENDGAQIDLDEASDGEIEDKSTSDHFNEHFGTAPDILTDGSVAAASGHQWTTEKTTLKGYGRAIQLRPAGSAPSTADVKTRLSPALAESLRKTVSSPLVFTSLAHLGSYKDLYLHSLDGEADGSEKTLHGDSKEAMRKAVMVHSLNHVLKTRRKIIRNNEKLAHAASDPSAPALDPPRDQSFTRPKVLLLLPLRSLALHYLTSHLFPLAPPGTQIENMRPFISSFSIPPDVEDPLASSSAVNEYPIDHLVNFKGNSDDNFRFGIKITRKAWRVVMMPANEAKLMECDILVASPLGIKMQSEREDSTDLLSSIEIAVADGMDVMQMQNWDHVQFVFNNLNKIPQSPHGCDFSRVKPWYLDQQAQYLRQTILMSRYDTPEARAIFHRQCFNLEGKIRLDKVDYDGVLSSIKRGVKQTFERVDLESGAKALGGEAAVEEVEQRFKHFTTKTIPALQRSAISRQNTLIVVPSYFDFVRLTDHLRKDDSISFTSISEYSSNSEISRARTLFFKGKKSYLFVTERFHFYRRYKLRGARTLVFYALPDHAQFYAEFMQTPFLPSRSGGVEVESEVDAEDVSSRVLVSRFDALKLERVIGSKDARQILSRGDERFVYA